MEEPNWVISLIVAWLPFLMFVGATLWVGRRIGRELKTPDGRSIDLVVDEYGRELKRSNDMLEQVLTDHRKRLDALKQRS
jgi:hypothetical protein